MASIQYTNYPRLPLSRSGCRKTTVENMLHQSTSDNNFTSPFHQITTKKIENNKNIKFYWHSSIHRYIGMAGNIKFWQFVYSKIAHTKKMLHEYRFEIIFYFSHHFAFANTRPINRPKANEANQFRQKHSTKS